MDTVFSTPTASASLRTPPCASCGRVVSCCLVMSIPGLLDAKFYLHGTLAILRSTPSYEHRRLFSISAPAFRDRHPLFVIDTLVSRSTPSFRYRHPLFEIDTFFSRSTYSVRDCHIRSWIDRFNLASLALGALTQRSVLL